MNLTLKRKIWGVALTVLLALVYALARFFDIDLGPVEVRPEDL